MKLFIELCVTRKLHTLTFQVFATGGGAFKFESDVRERLKIEWNKCDELGEKIFPHSLKGFLIKMFKIFLDMLIQGVEFLNEINCDKECYFFDIEPLNPSMNMGQNPGVSKD
jgi:pantothenate kinase